MGQGASSLAPRGVSRRPRSRPLGASASSPARPSCSGLDRSSPLWVSGLEREAEARRAAREVVAGSSRAQSPSTLSSLASPVPGRVRNAHLRARSLPLPDPSGAGPRSQFQLGSGLPPRPLAVRAAAAAATPLLGSPPLPAAAHQRAAASPVRERVLRRSPNGGAGWVREALGALRPGTRGESCGPRGLGLGGAVGGRGRCWTDGTAWDRGEGPSPGESPLQPSPSRCPLPV